MHKASDRPAEAGQRPFLPIPLAAALSLLLCQPVEAAPIQGAGAGIGRTELLVPAVRGQVGEITREIVVEDDVYAQEVIETGPSSAMRIGFRDGTKLSIGPSSRLVIDRYLYDPDVGRGEVALGFLAGIFEFVSGRLAPGSYDLRTPSGHLSIRGTEIIIDTAREFIAVPKGRVQLRATDGRSLTVSEGQCLQGRGGAAPARLGLQRFPGRLSRHGGDPGHRSGCGGTCRAGGRPAHAGRACGHAACVRRPGRPDPGRAGDGADTRGGRTAARGSGTARG
jgi:hypothetical protein